MTYLTYQRSFFWQLAQRMWCMLFHKASLEPHGSGEKCTICGEEYDEPSMYDCPKGYKN